MKKKLWAGRIMTALPVLFLTFDTAIKSDTRHGRRQYAETRACVFAGPGFPS